MYAQTIILPSTTELLYPTGAGGAGVAATIAHSSNYGYDNVMFQTNEGPQHNNLYVWTWGSVNVIDLPATGIAWRRTLNDPAMTNLNMGHLLLDFLAYDPEVAILKSNKNVFVVLAYYRTKDYGGDASLAGHYYNVYRWTPTGLIPHSVNNLLLSGTEYTRISIDAINLDKASIVLQTDHGIAFVNIKPDNVGNLLFSPINWISGTIDYTRPDVALTTIYTPSGVPKGTIMNVLSTRPTPTGMPPNEFNIVSNDFDAAFAGSGIFGLDWASSVYCAYPLATGWGPAMDGLHLHIDCPDSNSFNGWGIVFRNDNKVYSTVKHTTTSIPVITDITGMFTSNGHGTTIAYDRNPKIIHYGFHILNDILGYYGVSYYTNGVKIGGATEFKKIDDTPNNYQSTNTVVFNKQNRFSNRLFTSYNMAYSPYYLSWGQMRSRWTPWATVYSTFNESMPSVQDVNNIKVYPNPSDGIVTIDIEDNNLTRIYEYNIYGINGRLINTGIGNKSMVEKSISEIKGAGQYFIQMLNKESNKSYNASFIIK